MAKHYLHDHGRDLIANGYDIIPILPGEKRPSIKAWQKMAANDPQFEAWMGEGLGTHGVGILTANSPAIDIDIYDHAIVEQLVSWCEKYIGATGIRIGQEPKSLLLYRCDTPFSKMVSHGYIDARGRLNRIEILGQGQQFVAYHTHPETGKPYAWGEDRSPLLTRLDDLPILTEDKARALLEYFSTIVPRHWRMQNRTKQSRAKETPEDQHSMAGFAPPLDLTLEQIQATLAKIDATDYNVWIDIGMQLHHQFEGDVEGLDIWDTWSQKSTNYQPGATTRKWATFNTAPSRCPRTFASALRMVKNGLEGQEELVALNRERFVFVQDKNEVADLNQPPFDCILSMPAFHTLTQKIKITVPAPTDKDPDKVKHIPLWRYLSDDRDNKNARRLEYNPAMPRIFKNEYGQTIINSFHLKTYPYTRLTDKLQPFFDHMNYLFVYEDEREWFIDWLAFNLQHPSIRSKVTPMHVATATGTGRGWVVELLELLLGEHNVNKTELSDLCGEKSNFNDYFDECLLVCVDEAAERPKQYDTLEQIQGLLTDKRLKINRKYGTQKTKEVFCNVFMMLNSWGGFVITENDRRLNVLTGPSIPQPSEYYEKLYEQLNDDAFLGQLYHYLMSRDISEFNWKRCVHTPGREKMINLARSEVEHYFHDLLANLPSLVMKTHHVQNEIMRMQEDVDAFDRVGGSEKQIQKLLKLKCEPERISYKGRATRLWIMKKDQQMTNEEIRAELERYEKSLETPL